MKKLRNYVSSSIGLILLVTVVAFSVPQTGHSALVAGKDVRVINSASEAVPVEIGNGSANPVLTRDVDRPTAQPFQHQAILELADGQHTVDAQIPVPEGKLLVIEFISLNGSAPKDHQIYLSVLTRVAPDNIYRPHYIEYSKQDFGSFNHYTANQMVRIYADPPLATVRLQHLPLTGAVAFRCNISGYFVDK